MNPSDQTDSDSSAAVYKSDKKRVKVNFRHRFSLRNVGSNANARPCDLIRSRIEGANFFLSTPRGFLWKMWALRGLRVFLLVAYLAPNHSTTMREPRLILLPMWFSCSFSLLSFFRLARLDANLPSNDNKTSQKFEASWNGREGRAKS